MVDIKLLSEIGVLKINIKPKCPPVEGKDIYAVSTDAFVLITMRGSEIIDVEIHLNKEVVNEILSRVRVNESELINEINKLVREIDIRIGDYVTITPEYREMIRYDTAHRRRVGIVINRCRHDAFLVRVKWVGIRLPEDIYIGYLTRIDESSISERDLLALREWLAKHTQIFNRVYWARRKRNEV